MEKDQFFDRKLISKFRSKNFQRIFKIFRDFSKKSRFSENFRKIEKSVFEIIKEIFGFFDFSIFPKIFEKSRKIFDQNF